MEQCFDLVIEDERWAAQDLQACGERALHQIVQALELPQFEYEVSCLACDDARIAVLNGQFRAKDSATNVLSWPSQDRAPQTPGQQPHAPQMPELGDLAISFETCEREAAALALSMDAHVMHLLVHGMLHLLGYDHETDADATLMEQLETRLLANMGIADPYEA